MTKTQNKMMNSETNETDMVKGTNKGGKTKTDSSKHPELPNSITCHGCQQIFRKQDTKMLCCDRCENYIVQNVPKSQMQDINFFQVKKEKTLLGFAKAVYNQPW